MPQKEDSSASVQNFITVHPIVQIFQSGPTRTTRLDLREADRQISAASHYTFPEDSRVTLGASFRLNAWLLGIDGTGRVCGSHA